MKMRTIAALSMISALGVVSQLAPAGQGETADQFLRRQMSITDGAPHDAPTAASENRARGIAGRAGVRESTSPAANGSELDRQLSVTDGAPYGKWYD